MSVEREIGVFLELKDAEGLFWFQLPPATEAPHSRPSPCQGAEENGNK